MRIKLELLLSIIFTFGGIWYFLLIEIIEIYSLHPISKLLLPYGIFHYAIFIILCFALVLVHFEGLAIVSPGNTQIDLIRRWLTKLLLKNWLLLLGISVLASVMLRLEIQVNMYWVFAILIILLIPGLLKINFKYFANIQLFSRNLLDLFYNKILIIPFMLIGLALHVLSLSLIFSDVKFITDKALYSKQDKLLVSIKRSGYIYLPKIIKTTFNGKLIYLNGARSGFGNLTNLIDLTTADISSDNAFEAEYITQFISYTRKTELFVIIAP